MDSGFLHFDSGPRRTRRGTKSIAFALRPTQAVEGTSTDADLGTREEETSEERHSQLSIINYPLI